MWEQEFAAAYPLHYSQFAASPCIGSSRFVSGDENAGWPSADAQHVIVDQHQQQWQQQFPPFQQQMPHARFAQDQQMYSAGYEAEFEARCWLQNPHASSFQQEGFTTTQHAFDVIEALEVRN